MSAQHISLTRTKGISGSLDCVTANRINIQGGLMKKIRKKKIKPPLEDLQNPKFQI